MPPSRDSEYDSLPQDPLLVPWDDEKAFIIRGNADEEAGPMGRRCSVRKRAAWVAPLILVAVAATAAATFSLLRSAVHHRSVWSDSHRDGSACGKLDFACMAETATKTMDGVEERQSKTFDEAVTNYRNRYGREAPRGFAEWYAYAMANNATLIDEYDRIELDLTPLRKLGLTGVQLYDRMAKAWDSNRNLQVNRESLGSVTIVNGTLELSNEDFLLRSLLAPIADRLPDLSILYNWYDEPRVILPTNEDAGMFGNETAFEWENLSWRSTWDALRRPCARLRSDAAANDIRLPSDRYKDVCAMDEEGRRQHGFFNAPANFHPTQTLIPLLSNAKVSTMGDILAPPLAYYATKYRGNDDDDNVPAFADKKRGVYWRGSSTGMMMLQGHWLQGHRQRFVLRMRHLKEAVDAAKKALASATESVQQSVWPSWLATKSRFGEHTVKQLSLFGSDVANVAFSAYIHCDQTTCSEVNNAMPTQPGDAREASDAYQIVADLDGEGMSGRFYRLLASKSLPLKQTIWHEWHDGRIVPWVHYVPLTLGMHELRPLLAWLLTTDEGQRVGGRIAKRGREHVRSSFRQIDGTIYYYRLLLEWASLLHAQNDDK